MKKIILATILLILFFSQSAFAMEIFVPEPQNPIKVGDTALIKIMINTGKQEINAIDGKIKIEESGKIVFVNLAGSIFNLWPTKPSISSGEISFVGGTQSGVFGTNLKLFEIAINPQKVGTINIKIDNSSFALLNDGNGTKVNFSPYTKTINILPKSGEPRNEIASLVLYDKTPPEDFKIELGKDIKSYDNKYFISFNAIDKDSGINRYEIIEGDNPIIRSGSPYVLQDQTLKTKIEVRAIDNAGNIKIVKFSPKKGINSNFVILIIAIIIIALLFFNNFKKR